MTYCMIFLIAAGCSTFPKIFSPSQQKSTSRQQHSDTKTQQHADPIAQQQYYDQGLQHYSKDNYGEARAAFQQVVDLGPNTALGLKAKENLKKIDQILKTVEEIEAK